MTPFDVLNGIAGRKRLFTEEEVLNSGLNVKLLTNYLSSHPIGANIAGYLCKNHFMKLYDMYLFAYFTLPVNIKMIKYIKRDKIEEDSTIELLQNWYGCNRECALEYLSITSKEEIKELKAKVDVGGFSGKVKS